jgi:nitroimidazol reductase NimA-like FMN-containing flavoprotein (pyridoxamine 5'-phosphate oxidase superfamily)
MTTHELPDAMARRILAANTYMTLATADEEGRPWASPVWYARASATTFLWVSDPEARHSRNLARRAEIGVVVFDSTVAPGDGEAVYMEARAEELAGAELEHEIAIFSRRSTEAGAREWTLADVSPPARLRLFRAIASAVYVLGGDDRRFEVRLEDAAEGVG